MKVSVYRASQVVKETKKRDDKILNKVIPEIIQEFPHINAKDIEMHSDNCFVPEYNFGIIKEVEKSNLFTKWIAKRMESYATGYFYKGNLNIRVHTAPVLKDIK